MSSVVLDDAVRPSEQVGFAERFRPNETYESVLDVDFARQAEAGRTTLLLDAESTFVAYDGWDVNPEIVEKLKNARQEGIERIIITTNKSPKDEIDLWQLQWWGEQIGANLVIVPMAKEERKPSPHMLLQAMQQFEVPAESMLMVGDKLTSDVAAANAVNVHSIWVDKHGQADHIGDRVARRPAERALARFVLNRTAKNGKPIGPATPQLDQEPGSEVVKRGKIKEIAIPTYMVEHGLIAGYGAPRIVLEQDKLTQIPPRSSDKLTRPVKGMLSKMQSERFDAFMMEHGGMVADTSTYLRLALGATSAVLLLKGHRKAAFVTEVAGQVTDVIDGWASRKSKEEHNSEHRIKMGRREANIDKLFSLMMGVALVKDGSKPLEAFIAQQIRELTRGPQRRRHDEKGLDTRATRSSKTSTLGLNLADDISTIAGPGTLSSFVQYTATAGKYASSFHSPREWRYRRDRAAHAKQVEDFMTQRAA